MKKKTPAATPPLPQKERSTQPVVHTEEWDAARAEIVQTAQTSGQVSAAHSEHGSPAADTGRVTAVEAPPASAPYPGGSYVPSAMAQHAAFGPPRKVRSRHQKKVIKLIIGLAITALVIAGIVYGMIQLFFLEKPVHYDTEFIYRGSIENTVQGWGQVKPAESSDIGARVKGRVTESYFMAGELVMEGDLLFVLDTEALDAEVKVIQDRIDKANKEIEKLVGDAASLADNLTIRTPFKGKLLDAPDLNPGDPLEMGQSMGLLVDDSTMKASFYFSYAYENSISVGQAVELSIPSSMAVLEATVAEIHKVRKISAEGTTLFEVVISVKNPGTLAEDTACAAVLRDRNGVEIQPDDTAKLMYNRKQEITAKTSGVVTTYKGMSYMDYASGALLCQLEYKEDNEQVQALRQQIEEYEAEKEELAKEYDNLRVTADMSGTIIYNNAVIGQTVEPGTMLVSIAQMDTMVVEAQVDERDVALVQPGMQVIITTYGMEGEQQVFGTVKSIAMQGGGENGMSTFPAIFEIDNMGGQLLSGMYIDYKLSVEQHFDVLLAPVIAVKNTDEAGTCVFIKSDERPDNAVDLPEGIVPTGFFAVPVTCGIGNETGIEILDGVEEGAEVYTQISLLDDPNADPGFGGGGVIMYE